MRKKKLIVIISIISLLVILLSTFVFIYFFTDTFKSNKDLFSKYIIQNQAIMQIFKDEDIDGYNNRQSLTAYANKGSIKCDITNSANSAQTNLKALSKCNITFEGNVDNPHNYIYENIKANYSDTQAMNFEIIRDNDIYGLKINEVINKYIGIENNNLQEFAKKMGVDEQILQSIPSKLELASIQASTMFSNEELNQLKEKYLQIIYNHLTDDMFSKEKADNNTIYVLTLNQENIKNIVKDIIINIKDDETIWNKIKSFMRESLKIQEDQIEQYTQNIKEYIQNIFESANTGIDTDTTIIQDMPSEKEIIDIKIKVYENNKRLTKTEIIFSNGTENEDIKVCLSNSESGLRLEASQTDKTISINFQKIKNENNIKYELIAAQNNNQLFDLNIEITGLNTNDVQENAVLNFNSGMHDANSTDSKYTYTYSNLKTFGGEYTKVETDGNILLFNTAPNVEAAQKVLTQIYTRLEQVNSEKMKAAGLNKNESNPFMYYIPSIMATNGLFTEASENISQNANDLERDNIMILSTSIMTNIYQEIYVNEVKRTEKVTKKDIETGLKEANIDATVTENKDKTFTITVKSTNNKYNLDEKGKIISYEYANK